MHRSGSLSLVIPVFLILNAFAQDNFRDAERGIQTSVYDIYVHKGELLLFPFFEYTVDNDREYQPAEFDLGPEQDFRAKFNSISEQIFLAYGVTEWLALEFEAAYIDASFEKSPDDNSALPDKIDETGFTDIEGQLRFRLKKETDHRPEIYGFLEVTAPSQKDKLLIGDQDWDLKPGIGFIRSYSWGTMTFRSDLEYNREASHLDIGETSIEYFNQLSPSWRLYLSFEGGEGGAPDEWILVSGLQWRIAKFATLKFDNALGVFSKADDWAPAAGVLFNFSTR